jgi:predicted transcriptional regulator
MIQQILQRGNRQGMTMREITELTDLKQHQVEFKVQKLIKEGIVHKSVDRIDNAYLYTLTSYEELPPPVECSPVRLDNVIKHLNKQKETVNSPAHYNNNNVECIDALESGAEDLKKAQWYFDKLKEKEGV